jgi:pimeloyl-ACP methyl ester carboxylesterase
MTVDVDGGAVAASGRPGYLELGSDSVLTFMHEPRRPHPSSTAVVIVPPFGWEEVCSYRARRTWAIALSDAGFTTVRFDLPGAGDSLGSPRDPHRVDAWKTAVAEISRHLAGDRAITRVAAIGIGVGGIAAFLAMSEGAPIDDLVLWSVRAKGRAAVRELQAYAAVVAAPLGEESPVPATEPSAGLELTGFLMSDETVDALRSVDLAKVDVPDASRRRVLLLERDGLSVDQGLLDHLRDSGASVDVRATSDYEALVAHPQQGRAPLATIAETAAWLARGATYPTVGDESPIRGRRPLLKSEIEFDHGTTRIRETCLRLESESGARFAILTEPAAGDPAPISAVFLDAGAIRRIGPNRNWVELARLWAASGVPTLRVDRGAIGDSDGDERADLHDDALYDPSRAAEVRSWLDHMEGRDLPPRFVLLGLCSGAYWSVHMARADPRVVGAVMINLYAFFWSQALVAERDRRDTYTVLRSGVLRRVRGKGLTRDELRRGIRSVAGGNLRVGGTKSIESAETPKVDRLLDELRDSGTRALFLLSADEPLHEQFEREERLSELQRWPNVRVDLLPTKDHMYRAIWQQHRVREIVDAELRSVLKEELRRG